MPSPSCSIFETSILGTKLPAASSEKLSEGFRQRKQRKTRFEPCITIRFRRALDSEMQRLRPLAARSKRPSSEGCEYSETPEGLNGWAAI